MKICFTLLITLISIISGSIHAQLNIKGKVLDISDQPIPGVSIHEKGTNNAVLSNNDGSFEIGNLRSESVLVFNMLGYSTKEISIYDETFLEVRMEENILTLSRVEVVGSRSLNRSATETPVAIDIIPIAELINSTGQLDINQLLQYAAPSFNSNRQSGADGSDHVDPATLRGLGPDQTLVLINGKRRHQSALVNIFGARGRGNTGTDLNSIPASAIERIEILRDGASAQYGSDAIAGVINIVLKSNVDEFTGNVVEG
ncbi:MAG: TonB-dependent receptor plug domain-containing protein [Saprospiraceae bacterium]|nr:TonB-dependent receptor plug domain-containing protein [Saprospiraceae bacterium]